MLGFLFVVFQYIHFKHSLLQQIWVRNKKRILITPLQILTIKDFISMKIFTFTFIYLIDDVESLIAFPTDNRNYVIVETLKLSLRYQNSKCSSYNVYINLFYVWNEGFIIDSVFLSILLNYIQMSQYFVFCFVFSKPYSKKNATPLSKLCMREIEESMSDFFLGECINLFLFYQWYEWALSKVFTFLCHLTIKKERKKNKKRNIKIHPAFHPNFLFFLKNFPFIIIFFSSLTFF